MLNFLIKGWYKDPNLLRNEKQSFDQHLNKDFIEMRLYIGIEFDDDNDDNNHNKNRSITQTKSNK